MKNVKSEYTHSLKMSVSFCSFQKALYTEPPATFIWDPVLISTSTGTLGTTMRTGQKVSSTCCKAFCHACEDSESAGPLINVVNLDSINKWSLSTFVDFTWSRLSSIQSLGWFASISVWPSSEAVTNNNLADSGTSNCTRPGSTLWNKQMTYVNPINPKPAISARSVFPQSCHISTEKRHIFPYFSTFFQCFH